MAKLDEVYASASYEVRLKARIFRPVLAVLLGAFVLFALSTVLAGKFNFTLGLVTVIALVLAGCFWLLQTGRYNTAVLVTTLACLVLMMLNRVVVVYEGPQTIPQSAFTLTLILLVLGVFTSDQRWTLGAGIVVFVFSALMLVVGVVLGKIDADPAVLASLSVAPLLLIAFGTALGLTVQTLFTRVSRDLYAQLDESRKAQDKSRNAISQVARSLDQSESLSSAAEETAASGVQIERNVLSIKEQIVNLDKRFGNSEVALEHISQNLGQLGTLADRQTDIVSHSGSAVEEMVASIQSVSSIIESRSAEVQALRETAQDGRKAISDTSESFKVVVAQIENIAVMTKLISGIAAQTNLLAMNAAIEAAHAGDAGRGFSVVADEIRKLAESSRQGAGTIGASLKDLTKAVALTDSRVKASGAAFEEVRASVERVSSAMDEIGASTQEMNTGTEEILRSTSDLQTATQGVDTSVRQVAEAYQQILSDIRQVSRVIAEVASGMDEIGVGATEIRRAVATLTDLALGLKTQTALLEQALV